MDLLSAQGSLWILWALKYGQLALFEGSEVWDPVVQVVYGLWFMRIPNQGPILGEHRIYFGTLRGSHGRVPKTFGQPLGASGKEFRRGESIEGLCKAYKGVSKVQIPGM